MRATVLDRSTRELKATVDAGTFDPAQARIAKFGCDPHTNDACREQLFRQVVDRG
jgi:hypothetical protein